MKGRKRGYLVLTYILQVISYSFFIHLNLEDKICFSEELVNTQELVISLPSTSPNKIVVEFYKAHLKEISAFKLLTF